MPTLAAATAALILFTGQPTPPPALIGGGSLGGSHAREWSISRPSRGIHAGLVRLAATPPRGWSAFAACVEQRESKGHAGILNHEGSGAAGLFQFMPDWRHGAPFIVRERLIQFGIPKPLARQVRIHLTRIGRIEAWPAIYQRIAFAEVLEDGGWRHWSLTGSRCDSLVPKGAR